MPRGFHPVLLILALASPASVGALGLGDIHVDSALNEPLSAQIDIVGASLDDLNDLRAAIASLETFEHYGAERPAYLNSSTFKIGRDAEGHPVLNVRSRESFTDPLVSFLVDLKWRNNELVRDYSLLLDPAGLSASRRAAAATAAVAVKVAAAADTSQAAESRVPTSPARVEAPAAMPPATRTAAGALHRITSKDTLRAIVRHAGARSESQVQRMMIATFRANPGAFDGNINRLRRGALLNLATSEGMDAISPDEAKQAVEDQMTAWRAGSHAVTRTAPVAVVGTPAPAQAAPDSALTSRLHSLEQELVDLHQQIAKESANIQELKQAGDRPAGDRAATARPELDAVPAAPVRAPVPMSTNTLLAFAALLLGAVLAVYGYLRGRLQQRPATPGTPADTAPEVPIGASAEAAKPALAESPPISAAPRIAVPAAAPAAARLAPPVKAADPVVQGMTIEVDTEALERSYLESLGFNTSAGKTDPATGEFKFAQSPADAATATATVEMPAPKVKPTAVSAEIDMSDLFETDLEAPGVNTAVIKVDPTAKGVLEAADPANSVTTELDFNLSDLDATAQHVQMPSALNDHVEVSERRTSIVEVLKMAIDRDPHRRDLRMKLVETYYNAATGNRRAFMEVVRKLAREREYLSAEEWAKIVSMGRDLAPDDILFTDLVNDEDDVAA